MNFFVTSVSGDINAWSYFSMTVYFIEILIHIYITDIFPLIP